MENDDSGEDPEAMMRAATVRMHEKQESQFLGPASGIAITRLVMQLAKQFTDAKSIKEIVPEQRARQIKELYDAEQAKPSSKIYPLISDVAAPNLPSRALVDLLLTLYKLKVQAMYPALHEPTLEADVDLLCTPGTNPTPFQNFEVRMVIAISLQKMDTQYAGLADSYYLAALRYLDAVVQPMDLRTLQSFALMAEYSLLTPTRTAIYYVLGIATRLVQALGFHEEKTITRDATRPDGKADVLEVDMRRRMFWCIMVMEWGLAHALGRPAMLATSHEHLDVGWFETCEDVHIKPEGVDPKAQRPTLKKWISIHFFKMRLLQLEIRRTLYLRKRPRPISDSDEWFRQMDAKLCAWRDAAPSSDDSIGLDKTWFVGRYNTMVVFLYRPSPQVARPSAEAAMKCFEACSFNIHMQRGQITKKNVDLTWIFTQSIFMAINTMLWGLSYVEVRRKFPRAQVEADLEVAMDAIQLASERWPGVASAVQLYTNLIHAIMKIYDKDGDVPISATTPSDMPSPSVPFPDAFPRSNATSPATVSNSSIATPPPAERQAPFGYFNQQARRSIEQPPPLPYSSDRGSNQPVVSAPQFSPPIAQLSPPIADSSTAPQAGPSHAPHVYQQQQQFMQFDPSTFANPLPELTPGFNANAWQPDQGQMPAYDPYSAFQNPIFDPTHPAYPFPATQDGALPNFHEQQMMMPTDPTAYWNLEPNGNMYGGGAGQGLNQDQQQELMHMMEKDGMEDVQGMIQETIEAYNRSKANQAAAQGQQATQGG